MRSDYIACTCFIITTDFVSRMRKSSQGYSIDFPANVIKPIAAPQLLQEALYKVSNAHIMD